MNSVETTLRQQLAAICADLETKYPGCSEEILGRFFGSLSVPVLPVQSKEKKTKKVVEEKVVEEKKDGRKRVISKKMCEAFLALATSLKKENAESELESAKNAYKTVTDEELQQKGGDFTTWMHFFLTGAAPVPKEKKSKSKEKTPSRIDRWTPTLTRTLTKIVEENGGKMDDKHKKSFNEWIDSLTEDAFKASELAGHMRTWVNTTLVQERSNAAAPLPASPKPSLLAEEEEEEEEDLEEIDHEGESLSIGVKSGKIFRSTPAGDIWVGNAGVGRFSAVKRPQA
jgi:hypothetical protein